jgi:hypothetical protein
MLNDENLFANGFQSFNPCALTAARSPAPGRPRKVLSLASPDVPFLKKGRDKDVDTFSPNKTGFSSSSAQTSKNESAQTSKNESAQTSKNESAPTSTYKNSHHMTTHAAGI